MVRDESAMKKSVRWNSEILSAEIKEIEGEMWENNRFCDCGAGSFLDCSCEKEKRERFAKRVSRKKREILGDKPAKLLIASQELDEPLYGEVDGQ